MHKIIVLWQYSFRFIHIFTLSVFFNSFLYLQAVICNHFHSAQTPVTIFLWYFWYFPMVTNSVFICLKMSFEGYFCCLRSSRWAAIFFKLFGNIT